MELNSGIFREFILFIRNFVKLIFPIFDNLEVAKIRFLLFLKWQKINFCTRKNFKTAKNAIFGLEKLDFFGFTNFIFEFMKGIF